ncbi:uncharacterized protein LOC143285790 [Babylonia areolata]|uniref:uncharacterized protein LOC143285790 n=1 Tax=Babylonia areolata TaxID=304850 RepID=UPI003FD303CE
MATLKATPTSIQSAARLSRRESIESLICPKCQQFLAVRLQSRPNMTKQLQRILRKKKENNLTARQQQLLHRAMQHHNNLVLKCSPCQWQTKIQLQSREALHHHKTRLRLKAEKKQQSELVTSADLDKKAQKKMKKKERRKRSLETKMQDILQFKRLSSSFVKGTPERRDEMLMASTPVHVQSASPIPAQNSSVPKKVITEAEKPLPFYTPSPSYTKTACKPDRPAPHSDKVRSAGRALGSQRTGGQTVGKQQLRRVLDQKKKGNLSAGDSIAQFLNSLK